jgi:hypothetical protein
LCFSDDLRKKICEMYPIDLEPFVWPDELNNYLMNIKLDNNYEDINLSMKEIYEFGLNIGFCGLTSRYFARALPKADLAIGTFSLLRGTKKSKNGNHAWIINEGYIIDSTLKIIMPEKMAYDLGYKKEKILAYESARMLSEYELYSRAYKARNMDIQKFNEELLRIN